MTKHYTTRSWIYACGVTALFMFLLALNSPAQADSHYKIYGSATFKPVEKMQLARGDSVAAAPQRRTYEGADVITEPVVEPSKEVKKDRKGVQGPAGRTPAENGPQGKSPSQKNEALRIPGDVADGCSKYLRCSGD